MLRCIRMVILTAALLATTQSSAHACCLFPLLDPTFWFGGCCFNNPAAGREIIDDWLGYGYLKGQQGSLGHYPLRPWNCYTPAYTRLNAPAYYPPLMTRPMVAPLQPLPMPQPIFMPSTPFAGNCGCDPCNTCEPACDPCGDPCGDPCSGLAAGGMMMSPGGMAPQMMAPGMGYPTMGYPVPMSTPRFPTAFPSAWPTPQWKQTQFMAPSPMQTADCGCSGSSGAMNGTVSSAWTPQPAYTSAWTPQPQMAWNTQPQMAWNTQPQMAWTPQTQYGWRPQQQYAFRPVQPQMAWNMQPPMGWTPQPQMGWAAQPQMGWTPQPQTVYAGDIWGDHEYSSIPGSVPVPQVQSATVPVQQMSYPSRSVPVHRTAFSAMRSSGAGKRYSAVVR